MRMRSVMSAVLVALVALLAVPGSAFAFGLLSAFGPSGSAAGQIGFPEGIAVGPDGVIYVSDFGGQRVEVFQPDGLFVRAFGKGVNPAGGDVCTTATGCKAASVSGAAGGLDYPADVAVDPAGNVYVADYYNNRVDVFSAEGAFVRAFGKNVGGAGVAICTTQSGCQMGTSDGSAGAVAGPIGVEIRNETLYVVGVNNRIDVFALSGTFIRATGRAVNPGGGNVCTAASGCVASAESEVAGGLAAPTDLVITPNEQLAVADNHNHRVDVFDMAGNFIRAFGWGVVPGGSTTQLQVCTTATGCRKGSEAEGAGALPYPHGITLDPAGHLLIADALNRRVNEFTIEGAFIRAFAEGVIDGKAQFEVCTAQTGCRAGTESVNPGSLPYTFGVGVDCTGAIYATSFQFFAEAPHINRFGEPGIGYPPCASSTPSSSSSATVFSTAAAGGPVTARPIIQIEINKRLGTALLTATVSDAGLLAVEGKGILPAKRQAGRPGLIELLLAPNRALKRKLTKKHKAKVMLSITFAANNGASNRQTQPLTLKMVRPHRRHHR